MNRKSLDEWKARGDDVEGLPFIVVYSDKRTFPASDYFHTLGDAKDATSRRSAEHIYERKWDSDGQEVARKVGGK